MIGNPLLLPDEGYNISRSVRLRSSASAYFNRTPGSASNRTTWTWSGWVKRGALTTYYSLFSAGTTSPTYDGFRFDNSNCLQFFQAGAASVNLVTTPVYRDPCAWYHIVLSVDTTQATASNRVKIYVNGVQVTSFSTSNYPAQNASASINNNLLHVLGAQTDSGATSFYYDGYLTEINFIDGQALTPSSFGETDVLTGVWKPKKYTGTYGTNGFFLNFSDNSNNTAATIGKDYSGNGNNWTPNNISVTSGSTYDSMLDVPTQWADGGNGRGNYAVLNPLKKPSTSTISDANLTVTWAVAGGEQPASFALSSGKWYWEQTQSGTTAAPGIILETATPSASSISQGYHYYGNNGQFYTGTSGVAYGATFTTGDIIGVALDLDTNQITFYKNNVSQGAKSIVAGSYTPDFAAAGAQTINANFGQRPFSYTPPSGFKALNTLNLPAPTILKGNQYFDATTYTGNGSTLSVTNSGGMQPNLVWYKSRGAARDHGLFDSVRGATAYLGSNLTNAEQTVSGVTAFNSNGFTLGSAIGGNNSGEAFVGWQWKEGATQGFDIVTYTGTGVNRTVSHSLGVAPRMIIIKGRDGTANNWIVYHASVGNTAALFLNLTNAQDVGSAYWNNTTPTSTQFSLSTSSGSNSNGVNYVAYLFSEVAGFSRFGSYTGNGSTDGPFVFCGFRPRWIMVKRTDTAGFDWNIVDTARNTSNVTTSRLFADLSNAEDSSDNVCDVLSNGFKLRSTNTNTNANGGTYIYAAFAEFPFRTALAR